VFVSQTTFFNGVVTNTGAFSWLGTMSNNYVQTAGTNTLNGTSTITQNATVDGGLFNLNGQTYSNNLMIVGGGAGVLSNGVAGATFNGGLSNAATVAVTANTFFNGNVTNTGAFFFQGAISNNFVNSGNGTVTLNNTATITKTTTINGGTFNLNGQTLSNGLMIVDGGTGVLTNAVAGATVNGGVSNSATVAVTANTFFNGPVTNMGAFFFEGAISNSLVNNGSFNLNNNATLTGAPINNGTINVASSTLTVIPDWANAGSIQISGGVLAGGNVTNNNGEGFLGSGTISNLVINNGTLTASGGTLTLVQAPINNGTAIVASASVLNVLPAWTNSGLLSNAPTGTVDGGTLTNAGTINGLGFFNEQVVNQNRMNFGGTISNNYLQTAGSFTVNGSGTITGTATVNGGTFNLNGGTYSNGLMIVGGTGILTNGTAGATFNGGLSNDATVAVTADTFFNSAITNTGNFSVQGAVSNGFANSGTLTINNNTTITGVLNNDGTVNINNGALRMGNDLVDSGLINVGTGTTAATLSNANLYLVGSGEVNFTNASGSAANTLIVAGTFTNTTQSTIQSTKGGSVLMKFLDPTKIVTNQGTMSFDLSGGSGTLVLQVGSDATPNALFNSGTILAALTGATANRVYTFSNQFVNAGNFLVTNNSTAVGGSLSFVVAGGAVTNLSTGTMQLIASGTGSGVRDVMTLTSGGFVNNGTLLINQSGGTAGNNDLIVLSGPGASFSNAVGGQVIVGSGNIGSVQIMSDNPQNLGTNIVQGGTLTYLTRTGGSVNFTNKGVVILNGGNLAVGPAAGTVIVNSNGLIETTSGSGTLASQVVNLNGATLLATNGTLSLLVAPTQNGTITVANGGTINVAQAWVNNGTISLLGGSITNAAITNNSFISGYGTIDGGGVVNNGKLFADASSISGVGTETVRIASFTNNTGATIGTASSNAVLNLLTTGNTLINRGTISISGGTILFNGGAGTITNFNVIAGVGNVASFPIINAGTLASFVAQAPISGLSNLIATVGVTNNGLLGANNFINGAATLSLTVSGGGAAIVNQGTVALQGGFLTINGGAAAITNIANGFIFGTGTQNLSVANLTGGTIFASNGVFLLGLQGDANAGVISNANAGSTISLTNSIVINNGTVALNGGGFLLSGTVTNEGTIYGSGAFVSSIYNDTTGLISATGGVLNVATNLGETVSNFGQVSISSGATLNMSQAWLNSGTVTVQGGSLVGSTITNSGSITGFGTITPLVRNNGGATFTVTGGTMTLAIAPTQIGTFVITNGGTLNVLAAWQNSGTVNLFGGNIIGSTVTNAGTMTGFGGVKSLVNIGSIFVTNGTLQASTSFTQNNSVDIAANSRLDVTPSWANNGSISIDGGFISGGTMSNSATGLVRGFGTISNSVANLGTILATNGTLKWVNSLLQSGTIAIANAATFNTVQAWQNNGLVNIFGGTLAGATITNAATITGSGTISAALSNTGYLRATNGLLTVQTLAGNQAAGILEASAGATLSVNGTTSWLNNGQLTLTGGTVIGGAISNNASHIITGSGTINVNVYNSGSLVANTGSQMLTLNSSLVNLAGGVVAANSGNLVVNGTFTNAGTLNMIHSVGTFTGPVVNSGAWITDPTTNVFQGNYTVASSGFIQSGPGDVYIFSNNAMTASSFLNVSTNKNQYNTLQSTFDFANTLGATQQFALAGHDFGPSAASSTSTVFSSVNPLTLATYSNNFALGTLQISASTTVEVTDAFSLLGPGTNDGLMAALYLDNLNMGSNSLLLISANVQLYFINSNNWTMANIELEGNPGMDNSINGVHQFALIPEPSVLLLLLSGVATIHTARKRYARLAKAKASRPSGK
jgi:hypothetical protein